jgi:hypothetical protein
MSDCPDEKSETMEISAVTIEWQGKKYQLTAGAVEKAFERASFNVGGGSLARYFVEIGHDIKPAMSVFRELVPVPDEFLMNGESVRVASILRTLGFSVLDRRQPHVP